VDPILFKTSGDSILLAKPWHPFPRPASRESILDQ
jgi:hypothetical protein